MSGFHIPRWLDVILDAGDKVHKAVHPSRWGENKPCKCGEKTRYECEMRPGENCAEFRPPTGNSLPPSDIGPYPK